MVHLASVPAHRKVNRVDMGTADKVCAAALAVREQARRRGCAEREVSFVLLEMGGAFTAAIAVINGRIVDGAGGTSGPLGARAAGALDGEVAFLAGQVHKSLLFTGGASTIAGDPDGPAGSIASPTTARGRVAWEAYIEHGGGHLASVVGARRLRDHHFRPPRRHRRCARRTGTAVRGCSAPLRTLEGFASVAGQPLRSALIADRLASGTSAALVDGLVFATRPAPCSSSLRHGGCRAGLGIVRCLAFWSRGLTRCRGRRREPSPSSLTRSGISISTNP